MEVKSKRKIKDVDKQDNEHQGRTRWWKQKKIYLKARYKATKNIRTNVFATMSTSESLKGLRMVMQVYWETITKKSL